MGLSVGRGMFHDKQTHPEREDARSSCASTVDALHVSSETTTLLPTDRTTLYDLSIIKKSSGLDSLK